MSGLEPVIVDASVFASAWHIRTLRNFTGDLFVSEVMYNLLYKEKDYDGFVQTLRYFSSRWPDYPLEELSNFRKRLRPYERKTEYVSEIEDYLRWVYVPDPVKLTILDEYSFLREHSSLLFRTKRIAYYLKKCSIPFLDASNKFVDDKEKVFHSIRGPRWLLGILIEITSMTQYSQNPSLSFAGVIGGMVFAGIDP